jgi:hypothetical protein
MRATLVMKVRSWQSLEFEKAVSLPKRLSKERSGWATVKSEE